MVTPSRFTHTLTAVTTALAVGCLTACGSDSESSGAACDRTAIAEAVAAQGSADAPARLVEDGFGCADGWAYAYANVGEGEEDVTVTFVLQSSDGAWAVRDRETACKSPGDEVPEGIFHDACESN
jgi:hypothetical protein